ncbi:MAG: AAA family ATPase [Acholeplasmatales bacterium]|nr:AAA family ATPase [Acholeplasmatales bacterium]
MIKNVCIKNFRNISELSFDITEMTTVISGQNELGKSNALNAIMWLVTGTILTDKWGSGENDIDSIVPKNATKGINPDVAITFETGTKFSKKYITKYNRDGSKVTGHTTEFYINDVVCKNESEFTDALYPMIGYSPKLKTKDVNELRLFVDPLYALQKLDAKQLRALLVDLGCSVTDEELYAMGFEDLRELGTKHLGKWDVLRKELKDSIKKKTVELDGLNAKLETVVGVEESDPELLKSLNRDLETLISKKALIRSSNANPEIAELEKQAAVIQNNINNKIANHQNDISTKRSNLMMKRQMVLDKLNSSNTTKTNPLREELTSVNHKIGELKSAVNAYDLTIQNNSNLINSYITMGNQNKQAKTNLVLKLDLVSNSKYENFITCPICGSQFPANEKEEANFENHKLEEINKIRAEIDAAEKKNLEYKASYEKCKKLKDDAIAAKEHASDQLAELLVKKENLEKEISIIDATPVDMTEVNAIDNEIFMLNAPVDITTEEKELEQINISLRNLRTQNESAIQERINEIDTKIVEINTAISEENIKKSKFAEKQSYIENINKVRTDLNNDDSTLMRCNELIKTMISLINEKATEKTGLTFVMLEENLSNDGVKEVCYATVNDVPFKDVNTATKIRYGIKFIEKMKELLGHNTLPVLADRMEGIDNFDTIKTLTKEQLICTRVSSEAVITIR